MSPSILRWWQAAARSCERTDAGLRFLPMAGLCPGCFLPSLRLRPSGPNKRGRVSGRWSLRCVGGCGGTVFVGGPGAASAVVGWGQSLLSQCHGDAATVLLRRGASIQRARVSGPAADGLDLPGPEGESCCPWCAVVGLLHVRNDKSGRPYLSCEACGGKAFLKTRDGRDAAFGVALELAAQRRLLEAEARQRLDRLRRDPTFRAVDRAGRVEAEAALMARLVEADPYEQWLRAGRALLVPAPEAPMAEAEVAESHPERVEEAS